LCAAVEKGISEMKHDQPEQDPQMLHSKFSNSAQIYYVAIIDILQKWDKSKQAERYAKALLGKDLDGVSAQEPGPYQERFLRKMEGREYHLTKPSSPSHTQTPT
jgi:hypothetical protein